MSGRLGRLRTASQLLVGHRLQLVASAGLTSASGLLEGLGLAALLPMIETVVSGSPGDDGFSALIRSLFDAVGLPLNSLTLCVFIGLLFTLKTVLAYASAMTMTRTLRRVHVNLVERLFYSYSRARWDYLLTRRTGLLINTITRQVTDAVALLRTAMMQVNNVIYVLALIATALAVSLSLTLTALALLGISIIAIALFAPRMRREGQKIVRQSAHLLDAVREYLQGYKALRTTAVLEQAREEVGGYAQREADAMLRASRYHAILAVVPELLLLLALLAIIAIASGSGADAAEIGVVMALLLRVSTRAKQLREVGGLAERMPALGEIVRTLKDFDRHRERSVSGDARPVDFSSAISFVDVDYAYPGRSTRPVLTDVNLTIARGEFLGVVGASGAGKSTFVALLLGLLAPVRGTVSVDGHALEDIAEVPWLRQIGYVPQEAFLFNDTVRANIAFLRDVSDEQIEKAARMAHIHDVITALPDGYDTVVGDMGSALSGGERQRVCFARALVHEPTLLILDEATSSLDGPSERAIQEAIRDLKQHTTIISIAHRLSTLEDADRILVLHAGRVVEQGPAADLLELPGGHYRELHQAQRLGSSTAP